MNIQKIYDFKNYNVVITGGSGILGAEMVRSLASLGANIAILEQNQEKAEKLKEELKESSGEILIIKSDVTDKARLQENAKQIKETFGYIDALINAAGGNHPKATTSDTLSFFDLPATAIESVTKLNLLGTILPCQVFGKIMAEQKKEIF